MRRRRFHWQASIRYIWLNTPFADVPFPMQHFGRSGAAEWRKLLLTINTNVLDSY